MSVGAPSVPGLRAHAHRLTATAAGTSLVSLADQGLVSAMRLGLSVLVGRALGADGLGAWSLALTLVFFAEALVETLVSLPYTVAVGREARPGAYRRSARAMAVGVALACSAGAVGAAVLGAASLAPVFVAMALALPFRVLLEAARRFAFAHERVVTVLALDVGLAAGVAVGAAALWATDALTVPHLLLVFGLANALPAFWAMTRLPPQDGPVRARLATDLAAHWRFGRWVLGTRMAVTLREHAMTWAIAALAGVAAVGTFDAAGKMIGLATPVLIGLANVLGPRAARAHDHGGVGAVRRLVARATAALAGLTLALTLALWLVADPVLGFLYGPAFVGLSPLVFALGFGLTVEATGLAADAGLWAVGRPHAGFGIALAALATVAACGAFWMPTHGALGAAWALVAGRSLGSLLQVATFWRVTR